MSSEPLIGKRLPDTPIGPLPLPKEEMHPGDYWRVMTPDGSRPLDVREHPEDRYWGGDTDYRQNLTGGVWGFIDPNGNYGMLSIHTVREETDGTISVRPGDGSSNSILNTYSGQAGEETWHGYIEQGVWRSV